MISNTLKINAIILVAFALAASGGALIKQKTQIVDSYTNLKSNPSLSNIETNPGLQFHPHSEHYIYNFDTVEKTDKPEFKALASKLSKLPSNFPSTITLATVSASSVASSEVLNQGKSLSNRELYLISKYWLQLLPQFHPELLKCLAGPIAKPTQQGDEFPSNCPSEILYLNQNTEESSSATTITNTSFNIPYTLYSKLQKCSNSKCRGSKPENCYCTTKSCSNCSDINCKCYRESELTVGPRFFTQTIPSKFSYPNPTSQNSSPTFNATDTTKPSNHSSLPHFTFPLPHSSHTTPQTTNKSVDSLTNPIHWPQSITIKTNFNVTINNSENNNQNHKTLDTLVSTLLSSPSSFKTDTSENLIQNSPTQLFFVRYLATLYALLWSYSPDSVPLFPSNSTTDTLSEHNFNSLTQSHPSPFFNIQELPSNPITSKK